MSVSYEDALLLKLEAILADCEEAITVCADNAVNLIQQFMQEINNKQLFSPYLPVIHNDRGSVRIRWGMVVMNKATKKVGSMRNAPTTGNGDFDIRYFSIRSDEVRQLIQKYEDKFKIIRADIKQTKNITKSLKMRITHLKKGTRKTVIGVTRWFLCFFVYCEP
ncbi:hypothetical protein KOL64_21155 (plasmid) [Providencia rettgeri]|uniref:Uncharacterized protein n=1 Tax=Providencia rettgeri TaxID=587 RepID=A0AAJ6FTA4_PRORE|nr:hypothetical protein [Providencia rettgeri]WHT81734.1 hypothetical protein KOL65_20240 [Providencia rettgeri]WHT95932.1 hypothetical protein KOF27_20725 [Providencia rettgeri]WJM88297.1 hypothetical protein KOL64_21155 [Providencia rettgeri]